MFADGMLDVSANTGQGSAAITEDAYVDLPNGLEITNHPATNAAEPNVGVPGPFPTGTAAHVVAVYDHTDASAGVNGSMHLYLDGELQGSNEIHADMALRTFNDNNNWLGLSQWNDPVFDGSFDEFRVYDVSLDNNQVAASYSRDPNVVPEPTALAGFAATAGLWNKPKRWGWPNV